MDAALHEKIAHDAEADYQVEAPKEKIVVEDKVEAAEGGIEHSAGSDKEKSAMQFRLVAPRDRESKQGAEHRHVVERNDEESLGTRLVECGGIEAGHDERGCDAERDDRRAERRSEPAEEAMPLYVARADQSGLEREKKNPCGERCPVEP